jgi:predicted deacylase
LAPGSPVHCSIDLEAPGKHVGQLELARSTNTSGWSHLFIPIVSIKGGDGPTALVVGGNYLLAPESGLWETFVDLGDRVAAGDPVAQIHFLERPERDPAVVRARSDGIVFVVRAIAPTEQGDNVAVIAREIEIRDLH